MEQTNDDSQQGEGYLCLSPSFFGAVIDNLPVAIFAKDVSNDYRFILWNKKQESVTSISRQKAIGRNDFELFSPESARYFRSIDQEIVSSGITLEIPEEVLDMAAHGKVYLHTIKLPVKTGNRIILVGISEDITTKVTGRNRIEELGRNLDEKKEELDMAYQLLTQSAKLELMGRLAAGVAHEVKRPLNLILHGVEFLMNGGGANPEDSTVQRILIEMKDSVWSAAKIADGFVDVSADRRLSCEPVNIVDLVENVLLLIRYEITRSGTTVIRCFQSELPLVPMDRGKMVQVLLNLIANAIQAMKGVPHPMLTIAARTEAFSAKDGEADAQQAGVRPGDPVLVIEVTDSGSGVKVENLEKVFDPFFTTKPPGEGTGIGLFLVRRIVELHGGNISIRNNPDRGATVTLILPLAPRPQPADATFPNP